MVWPNGTIEILASAYRDRGMRSEAFTAANPLGLSALGNDQTFRDNLCAHHQCDARSIGHY
jgi:hypothetical protein